MKIKCGFKIPLVVFILVLSFILSNKSSSILLDTVLLNVEALAMGEGSGAYCIGAGSIDCPNRTKVYFVYM